MLPPARRMLDTGCGSAGNEFSKDVGISVSSQNASVKIGHISLYFPWMSCFQQAGNGLLFCVFSCSFNNIGLSKKDIP